jgi:hypothetical protein
MAYVLVDHGLRFGVRDLIGPELCGARVWNHRSLSLLAERRPLPRLTDARSPVSSTLCRSAASGR